MKYAGDRPYSDPEKAARRLMEHARAFEPIQDGRTWSRDDRGSSRSPAARVMAIDELTRGRWQNANLAANGRTGRPAGSGRRDRPGDRCAAAELPC
jgi:hypothetical protein